MAAADTRLEAAVAALRKWWVPGTPWVRLSWEGMPPGLPHPPTVTMGQVAGADPSPVRQKTPSPPAAAPPAPQQDDDDDDGAGGWITVKSKADRARHKRRKQERKWVHKHNSSLPLGAAPVTTVKETRSRG